MQHNLSVSPMKLGRAAFQAAVRLEDYPAMRATHTPELGSDVFGEWSELNEEQQRTWCEIGSAALAAAGLHVLAEDVMADQAASTAGVVEVGSGRFMQDAKGNLIGLGQIKPQRILEDEMVRKVMRFARELSDQIRRFKGHTFEDLAAFQSLLEQHYGAKAGGAKGNVTFSTFDDSMRVEVKIADQIAFGPELQSAKKLVDECLTEWGADSHEMIRSLVNRVFSVEKEGQINRGELFALLAIEHSDARWQSAMEAIRDSIRVIGTKAYLRFRIRDDDGAWSTVTIDLAAA